MTSTERQRFLNAGFTSDQVDEIEEGLNEHLNVAIYVERDFLSIQMRQIRLGLKEHLPVEVYAKVEYDWFQMEEIRKGLKSGVDINIYASPKIPYEKMREIRKGLENGFDLSTFLRLSAGMIRELRKAKIAGVNIVNYIKEGYDPPQLCEIRYALEKGVDIAPYLSREYKGASIAQIRTGLERGVDVSLYAKGYYTWRQMREIRKGLENRVAVEKYSSRLYSGEQMREIRLGLQQGVDVEEYRRLRYTAGEMRNRRLALLDDHRLIQEAVQEIPENPETQVKSEDFMFEFAANDMEAYITALTEEKKVTREKLFEILEQNGIRKGFCEDTIEKIVSGKYGKTSMLIARGEEPKKGEDGWYEFFFRTNIDRKPKLLEDGSVDFQNIDWFEIVQQGQKLAQYHEAQEGTDGYTVKGFVIKAKKGSEQRILTGKGFKMSEDKKTYIADVTGMISLEDNKIQITQYMVVDEINMATGSINFEGSVHVLGNVGNGTTVKAGGDVVVDGNVEGAIIESGGGVVLKKGMNAAGRGQITAEGDVVSRFFEAVKVDAKGNIEVDKCLNSQLNAGGKITSSKAIAGGVAHAEEGFFLNNVGNQTGLHTVLKLKVNDQVLEESKKINAAIRDAMHELEMLNRSYDEFKVKFAPEIRNNMDMFHKVEKAVFVKKKQIEQLTKLKEEQDKNAKKVKDARVVIRGQAYDGTVLEMNGGRWFAENQHNITVKRQNAQIEILNN